MRGRSSIAAIAAATAFVFAASAVSAFAEDDRPPDEACGCYTCRTHSRAYLRHLFLAGEMTAATLNSIHNIQFYLDTMEAIRDSIVFGRFEAFRQALRQAWSPRPPDP